MRAFDFDNTIYKGESVFHFYLFSIKYNPRVARYIPIVFLNLIKYKLGKTTMQDLEEAAKKYSNDYLNSFDNKEEIIKAFWDKHIKNIKPWYEPQEDDIIITASFNLIMDELCKRLGIKNCICSVVNRDTMQVEYLNFRENKRKTFVEKYKDKSVDEFYTDNMFDKPMIDIAKKAYLVKGNRIKRVK
ncbi:MAG: haloacid dehalogenase-like hydrolase [Eubacterium sp.]